MSESEKKEPTIKKYKLTLPVDLTDAEIRKMAQRLAEIDGETHDADDSLDSAKSLHKATTARLRVEQNRLYSSVTSGIENRPVDVEEQMFAEEKIVRVIRTDNYTTVSDRPMTEAELQGDLPFDHMTDFDPEEN